jgi:methylated-DNA-[protein]-cysteine S-methyltransferase
VTALVSRLATPLGELVLLGDEEALAGVWFADGRCPPLDGARTADAPFAAAREQLAQWLAGERRAFDLPLRPAGTPFQHRVWALLAAIPYGATTTYGELARRLGTAPRAVGLANGRNPLSIVVPCHRVVGGDGALTGYAGGLERKRALLALERRSAQRSSRVGSASARRSDANATVPTSSGSQNRISR